MILGSASHVVGRQGLPCPPLERFRFRKDGPRLLCIAESSPPENTSPMDPVAIGKVKEASRVTLDERRGESLGTSPLISRPCSLPRSQVS